jgi:hypothetical protein
MLIPISGDKQFIPPTRKIRNSPGEEKISFEDLLVEKVEAAGEGARGEGESGRPGGQEENAARDAQPGAGLGSSGTQGSAPDVLHELRGRRIDLRA